MSKAIAPNPLPPTASRRQQINWLSALKPGDLLVIDEWVRGKRLMRHQLTKCRVDKVEVDEFGCRPCVWLTGPRGGRGRWLFLEVGVVGSEESPIAAYRATRSTWGEKFLSTDSITVQ